jgi:hypothetical protein
MKKAKAGRFQHRIAKPAHSSNSPNKFGQLIFLNNQPWGIL